MIAEILRFNLRGMTQNSGFWKEIDGDGNKVYCGGVMQSETFGKRTITGCNHK